MGIFTQEMTKITVIEVAGTECCVAARDGQKVHDRIRAAFCESRSVEVSFEGISDITPAFLNSAVGQLYGSIPADGIEINISFTDIPKEDEFILKRIIERAKTYFENAYSCRKVISDELGGEDV